VTGKALQQLKRMINGISQRIADLDLGAAGARRLVTRTIFPTIPPRLDYELTDLGRGLQQPVMAPGLWAKDHQEQIAAARTRSTSATAPEAE